ncbi:hypothetical protein MKMG_01271 [Methanogenium sp. MK-MG]|nr:hypothetical protein MKMG_01271 [Methanogenium sp. MK-MG]
MLCSGNLRSFLPGQITGDTDETTHVTQFEGEMPLPVGPAACLEQEFVNRTLVKVRDLAVIPDFLGDEPDELVAVLRRVEHRLLHIDLVPIAADTGPECRVHPLHTVHIACRHHHKPARDRLCPDHGTT